MLTQNLGSLHYGSFEVLPEQVTAPPPLINHRIHRILLQPPNPHPMYPPIARPKKHKRTAKA